MTAELRQKDGEIPALAPNLVTVTVDDGKGRLFLLETGRIRAGEG